VDDVAVVRGVDQVGGGFDFFVGEAGGHAGESSGEGAEPQNRHGAATRGSHGNPPRNGQDAQGDEITRVGPEPPRDAQRCSGPGDDLGGAFPRVDEHEGNDDEGIGPGSCGVARGADQSGDQDRGDQEASEVAELTGHPSGQESCAFEDVVVEEENDQRAPPERVSQRREV